MSFYWLYYRIYHDTVAKILEGNGGASEDDNDGQKATEQDLESMPGILLEFDRLALTSLIKGE